MTITQLQECTNKIANMIKQSAGIEVEVDYINDNEFAFTSDKANQVKLNSICEELGEIVDTDTTDDLIVVFVNVGK